MSKRDELSTDAGCEYGVFAFILIAAGSLFAKALFGNKNRKDLETQIKQKDFKITGLDPKIKTEQQKGFFSRDYSKMDAYKQEKSSLMNERDNLASQYEKKYKK